jgi:hypothetical protein
MKLYRLYWQDMNNGTLQSWHPSKRDAEKAHTKELRESSKAAAGPSGIDAIDIPTDKAGLLVWLNTYFVSDNG